MQSHAVSWILLVGSVFQVADAPPPFTIPFAVLPLSQVEMYKRLEKAAGEDPEDRYRIAQSKTGRINTATPWLSVPSLVLLDSYLCHLLYTSLHNIIKLSSQSSCLRKVTRRECAAFLMWGLQAHHHSGWHADVWAQWTLESIPKSNCRILCNFQSFCRSKLLWCIFCWMHLLFHHYIWTLPTLPGKQDGAHEPECWHVCWGRKMEKGNTPWHSCGTPSHEALIWHSCATLLLDTLVAHSDLTRFLDTLTWHAFLTLLQDTLTWHSCGTLLLDALVRHSYMTRHAFLTLLQDTLTWHSCGTLLLDALVRHSYMTRHAFLTLLQDTLTWHFCKTLLLDTFVGHSYLTLL